MHKKIFIGPITGNAQRKAVLLQCVKDFTKTMDEISKTIVGIVDGDKTPTLRLGISLSSALENIILSMRGITFRAITDLPDDADRAEVIFAAANLCRAAVDVKEILDDILDKKMKNADDILFAAIDALDHANEEEAGFEDGGKMPSAVTSVLATLFESGILPKGGILTVKVIAAMPASNI